MKKLVAIIMVLTALYSVKSAVAISANELMTNDGNVWAVYDELEIDKEYTLIFDTLGDNNIYNDRIINII